MYVQGCSDALHHCAFCYCLIFAQRMLCIVHTHFAFLLEDFHSFWVYCMPSLAQFVYVCTQLSVYQYKRGKPASILISSQVGYVPHTDMCTLPVYHSSEHILNVSFVLRHSRKCQWFLLQQFASCVLPGMAENLLQELPLHSNNIHNKSSSSHTCLRNAEDSSNFLRLRQVSCWSWLCLCRGCPCYNLSICTAFAKVAANSQVVLGQVVQQGSGSHPIRGAAASARLRAGSMPDAAAAKG